MIEYRYLFFYHFETIFIKFNDNLLSDSFFVHLMIYKYISLYRIFYFSYILADLRDYILKHLANFVPYFHIRIYTYPYQFHYTSQYQYYNVTVFPLLPFIDQHAIQKLVFFYLTRHKSCNCLAGYLRVCFPQPTLRCGFCIHC